MGNNEGAVLLIAIFFLVILTVGGIMWAEATACAAKATSFTSYDWGPIQGCMVLHNDRWLPLENIRVFD